MCKTRSKDSARTGCDGDAVAVDTRTGQTDGQQQPSLREAGCEASARTGTATRVPVVAPGDARTMEQILSRDQRTTYHRLNDAAAAARGPAVRQQPQQQQQQQPQSSAAGCAPSSGCPLPEILDLIGDSVPWCLGRANRRDLDKPQHCPPTTGYLASATTNNRKRKASLTNVDIEQQLQLQLQLQRTCQVQNYSCDLSEDGSVVVLSQNNLPTPHCQPPSTTHRNKSLIAFVTWLRLVGLLVALSLVSVESAPTAMTLESRRLDQAPKWLNPCGFAAEEFEGDVDVVQLNDAMLLGQIVTQATTALDYAHGFRDDYIKKTFNTDYADLHLTWKDNHYDWLPGPKQIPKKLGEHLDQDYLHKLEVRMLDTALLDAYEYMQRYAVGLEQIAWDQEDYALEFRKQFKDTEYNLRSVLCELQMAMAERGVTPRADVTREVMAVEFRDMSESATYRNLRDWLIFRDYMNGLEYVVQVFEHFIRCFES